MIFEIGNNDLIILMFSTGGAPARDSNDADLSVRTPPLNLGIFLEACEKMLV